MFSGRSTGSVGESVDSVWTQLLMVLLELVRILELSIMGYVQVHLLIALFPSGVIMGNPLGSFSWVDLGGSNGSGLEVSLTKLADDY